MGIITPILSIYIKHKAQEKYKTKLINESTKTDRKTVTDMGER